ncbi:hypothetical protein L3X39_09700 [Sabulilitoribacter multivorans]|uniref:ATP-binding protein n=1 Tax=Flaviramulus multivorans TaxID=1304750 RepID=A0ABS9IJW7_9FLAO|nr:hypothetical protein [Flaviramulus multivorans]MCF7560908.1 hypothetical protein [Flaviramulus multivorans]
MISILKNNKTLTTFSFYSSFLKQVALYIKDKNDIKFKLVENGDNLIFDSNYRIDPITIPLLLSLIEQLSKFYKKPIELSLFNNHATKDVLKFLHKSDFFYLSGNNKNPYFPYGRKILDFNEAYLGNFAKKDPRPEHRVRCYSLNDNNLSEKLKIFKDEDERRDFLISEYIYTVREHFQELLFDNISTAEDTDFYIEILSELITNGVLHSKSNTFALMFVNRYSTKFSISDNGIGFEESLKSKNESYIYKPSELKHKLDKIKILKVNDKVLNNLNFIMETLYFSTLKNRRGLFDLMASVVLDTNGYFRLHNDNAQIIISSRMRNELLELRKLRDRLFQYYMEIIINEIEDDRFKEEMVSIKNEILEYFVQLYCILCDKYNNDFKYSSIRFYSVKFKGVHIEVEIPAV